MNFIFACIYNLILIAGTAYLVQFHNWSAWWFLLTCLLLATGGDEKCKK